MHPIPVKKPSLRAAPYIWVSWLSKLIVGDSSCEWAAWFKAHHQNYAKNPSTLDQTITKINHTALLKKTKEQLEAQGMVVSVEAQNLFHLPGKTVTFGGKPDLIGIKETGLICDVKTGQPKDSDKVQVMLYMFLVPLAFKQYKGMQFDGLVVYNDHQVPISAKEISDTFKQIVLDLIKRVVAHEEAGRVPSHAECLYCDITKADCIDRVEGMDENDQPETTTIF